MARKPSVILTPTEKKQAVTTAKDVVKTAKAELARLTAASNDAAKAHKKAVGELEAKHAAFLKVSTRNIAAAKKELDKAEQALLALTGPPAAVPSPTTPA